MPKEKLTVGVTGGRAFRDYYSVQKALAKVSGQFDITVVHGDCPTGADRFARIWCERTGTPQRPYPADWGALGDGAGPARNQQMVDEGNIQLLLAFPGRSGTHDMMQRCFAAGIPVKQIKERVTDDRPQAEQEPAAEAAT